MTTRRVLHLSALTAMGGALAGVAFAMWIENGARLFATLARTGLAWCF